MAVLDPASVLFITLDSCRYDTFAGADLPNMRAVGPLHLAQAPSHFTYGSHSAMFVGFTPSLPGAAQPILDNKFGKLFKIGGKNLGLKGFEPFKLKGNSIVTGFRNLGYRTLGTGAVRWFDHATPTGRHLTKDFNKFFLPGNTFSLQRQIDWMMRRIAETKARPVFAFMNIGETHVPYYFEGAAWSEKDNPCKPYQKRNRAAECARRQRACVEFVDAKLAPLLDLFAPATTLICADHGDCWGEDGLWEHGVSHEKTLSVPMVIRLRGTPVAATGPASAAEAEIESDAASGIESESAPEADAA